MCLEEMTKHAVPEGALYYATSRRRRVVFFTDALRMQVREIASAVKTMLASAELPPPTADVKRCKGCSLRERCQPEALARLRGIDASLTAFDPDA